MYIDRTTEILMTIAKTYPDLTGEEAQAVAETLAEWSDEYERRQTVKQTGNLWLSLS